MILVAFISKILIVFVPEHSCILIVYKVGNEGIGIEDSGQKLIILHVRIYEFLY